MRIFVKRLYLINLKTNHSINKSTNHLFTMPQKKYLPYLVILFAAVTLQTCTVDDGPKPCNSTTTYHYLRADQLSKTPYFNNPNFDTISFASDKGDTVTFALKKIDTTYHIEDANFNPNRICNYWNYYQNITATYHTIKGSASFKVQHAKKRTISFTIGKPTTEYTDNVNIAFNSVNYYLYDFDIGNDRLRQFQNNIVFNNRNYKNSVYVYREFSDSITGVMYINKDFGAFRINDIQNGKQFTIINP